MHRKATKNQDDPDGVTDARDGDAVDGPMRRLGKSTIATILRIHFRIIGLKCPSLPGKTIVPHSLQNSSAMLLLEAGVDINVIAGWSGGQPLETTQI